MILPLCMDYLKVTENVYCDKIKYNSAIKKINTELYRYGLPKSNLKSSVFRYAKVYHNELLTGTTLTERQLWVIRTFNIPLKKNTQTPKSIKLRIFKPNFTPPSRKLEYWEFLQTSYWFGVKDLVLKRDNHKCVKCNSKDKLHIHHTTYIHHFSEHKHLEDLETLCDICHGLAHCIPEKQMIEQHLNSI